jgi:hypothetical protein
MISFDYELNIKESPARWEFSVNVTDGDKHKSTCHYLPEYMTPEDILKSFHQIFRAINEAVEIKIK